MNQEIETQTCF